MDREKIIKGLQIHADGCGYRSHHCDVMECPYRYGDESCDIEEMCRDALELLKEQALGHWIFLTDCSNSGVYCSECNTKVFDKYPFKKKFSYFCPHCGTRMEGEIERQ